MDVDSPTNRMDDDDDDDLEPSYDAGLLELEPLREDSDDLLGDDDGGHTKDGSSEVDSNPKEQLSSEPEEDSATSSEEDDAHVQGLTSNEREILTLLAVDKKVASLLELAANALSALRLREDKDHTENPESIQSGALSGEVKPDKTASPLQSFETAAAEYYKALDDIQLTLRHSIHVIRKSRISPRTLMENPALGSVLAGGTGDSRTTGIEELVAVAPGVVPSKGAGLSKGAQRMELETWKDGITALKGLLGTLDRPAMQNGHDHVRQGSINESDH